jgi:hypothetical protein
MTILNNIDHLKDQLTQVDNDTWKFKTNDNIFKKEGEQFRFIRFDTIKSHIDDVYTDRSLKDIYENIISKLDYELKYGEERSKLVNQLFESNTWIYTMVSTERMMMKENKKKNSFRAEEQPFDKLMERVSSYIAFAKFKNEEDEAQYLESIKQIQDLEKKGISKRTNEENDELSDLLNFTQNYHHRLLRNETTGSHSEHMKDELVPSLIEREKAGYFIYSEENSARQKKVIKNNKKDDLDEDYFNRMFPSSRKSIIPWYDEDLHNEEFNKSVISKQIRLEMIQNLQKTVENFAKLTGLHLKDKDEKKEFVDNLIKEKGRKYYSLLVRTYNSLKSDYELSKKLLTVEIIPKKLEKNTTVVSIDEDTWYEHNGEIVELSRNLVSLADVNTYKALLGEYKDLRDKYSDKFESNFWGLIKVFEELMENTNFIDEEMFVLDLLFDNYSQKEIRDKYSEIGFGQLTNRRISNMINSTIPNKILETYLNSTEEWLYTYKIKGKYKTCKKCGNTKILNEKHWHKEPKGQDGFKKSCKSCN